MELTEHIYSWCPKLGNILHQCKIKYIDYGIKNAECWRIEAFEL